MDFSLRSSLPKVCFIIVGLFSFQRSFCATSTWNGGGGAGTWSTDANWNPSGDPALNSDISMDGILFLTNNIDAGAGITLQYNSITFSSGAGGSLLIGGGTVTNGGGGITINTKNFSQTMTNTTTVLSASQTWTVESNSFRTDANVILGGNGLLATGVSNVTINGNITGAGEISHSGLGKLILSGDNSAFSGAITNNSGTIESQSGNSLGSSSSLVLNGGTLLFNALITNTTAAIVLNGGAIQEVDTNVSLGVMTLSSNSSIHLNSGGNAGGFTFISGTNTIGSGAKLTIYGWDVNSAGSGSDDLIFFTDSSFETSSFLDNVTFFGTGGGARLLSSGELVPITPESNTVAFAGALFALLTWRCLRLKTFLRTENEVS